MSTLATRISSRRKELQMTQEELARKLGYKTKSTISRIESGDNDIPLNKVDAFANALETTRAYIMGWETAPAAPTAYIDVNTPTAASNDVKAPAAVSPFNDATVPTVASNAANTAAAPSASIGTPSASDTVNQAATSAPDAALGDGDTDTFSAQSDSTPSDVLPTIISFEDVQEDNIKRLLEKYPELHGVNVKVFPLAGKAACGEPIIINPEYQSYVMTDVDIKADICILAHGDSMINARILDGDVVFIKQCPIVDNGEIAAVIIGDTITLKRVYYDRAANRITLVAENPAYAPFVYQGEELEHIRILGKAVCFQSVAR